MAEEKTNEQKIPTQETLRPLRTFESDAAEAMKGGMSMAKIAVSEFEKPKNDSEMIVSEGPRDPSRKRFTIIAGVIVLVSIVLITGAYFLFRPETKPPAPVISGKPIINVDQEKTLDMTNFDGKRLISAIVQEKNKASVKLNSIEAIKTAKKTAAGTYLPVSTSEFLSKISPSAPGTLVRALQNDFVLGLLSYDGNQPFLIFKTEAFDYAYSGMLKWEANLGTELGEIFSDGAGSLQTANSSSTAIVSPFEDLIVDNLDTRVIKGTDGKVSLLYSFVDESTLLITTDPKTFSVLVLRIRSTRMAQ